ncbi:MAG: hypothetical protein ACK4E0_03225 [Chitinophagaceae bacterium]
MMTKKEKKITPFPEYILRDWEASDGVNFAVALARITGWLLHVDWWSPTDNKEVVENMKSLRVYVGTNSNHIYDLKGKYTIATFTNNIIMSIAKKRGEDYGAGVTRYYSEAKLFTLPLRVKPDESRIKAAQEIINAHKSFLEQIQQRLEPNVPADIAAKFTFGKCNPFATALHDLKGYKPVAIIAKEYNKLFALSKTGYAHSFVFDNNGNALDVWGNDTVENITQRFGIVKYDLDETEHFKVNQKLKSNSPDEYAEIYEEAIAIINEYFV